MVIQKHWWISILADYSYNERFIMKILRMMRLYREQYICNMKTFCNSFTTNESYFTQVAAKNGIYMPGVTNSRTPNVQTHPWTKVSPFFFHTESL